MFIVCSRCFAALVDENIVLEKIGHSVKADPSAQVEYVIEMRFAANIEQQDRGDGED